MQIFILSNLHDHHRQQKKHSFYHRVVIKYGHERLPCLEREKEEKTQSYDSTLIYLHKRTYTPSLHATTSDGI